MKTRHIFGYYDLNKFNSTEHAYLLTPALFTQQLTDLHPVQRTFKAENKGFWRETARANIKGIRELRRRALTVEGYIRDQKEPATKDQLAYQDDLVNNINIHAAALSTALNHRHHCFGLHKTLLSESKEMIVFFTGLRMLNKQIENTAFLGNIIEDALGIFQQRIFYDTPHEGELGLNNEPLLKRIIADINCETYTGGFSTILPVQIATQMVSERLAQLAKRSTYTMPTYQIPHITCKPSNRIKAMS